MKSISELPKDQREQYDWFCKVQGKLFKMIGDIEAVKINMVSGKPNPCETLQGCIWFSMPVLTPLHRICLAPDNEKIRRGCLTIQCAICINEITCIDILHDIWKEQEEFNTYYLRYQNAARKYQCHDFMMKFTPRKKHISRNNE